MSTLTPSPRHVCLGWRVPAGCAWERQAPLHPPPHGLTTRPAAPHARPPERPPLWPGAEPQIRPYRCQRGQRGVDGPDGCCEVSGSDECPVWTLSASYKHHRTQEPPGACPLRARGAVRPLFLVVLVKSKRPDHVTE